MTVSLRACLMLAFLCLAQAAIAQSNPPSAPDDPTEKAVRLMVERELGNRNRLDIRVGQFDPRIKLAPCARAEPFVPPGMRLWGRTQVGVRCIEGASWAIRLPVNIQVYAQVAVAKLALAAGATLEPGDTRFEEYELTRETTPLVTDPAALAGKQLTRAVAAGQPLRLDSLRTPPTVNPGDPVRIMVIGQGFSLTSEGVALAPAADGQSLRVRTESGRVVAGMLRDRMIEVRL